MESGTHPRGSWVTDGFKCHVEHAFNHLGRYIDGDRSENHIAHALWRMMAAAELEPAEIPLPAVCCQPVPPPVDQAVQIPIPDDAPAREWVSRAWRAPGGSLIYEYGEEG